MVAAMPSVRTATHREFRFRIDTKAVEAFVVSRDSVAKRLSAPRNGVLVNIRFNGLAGGTLHFRRGRKIGKALREINSPVVEGQSRHLTDDGLFELNSASTLKTGSNHG